MLSGVPLGWALVATIPAVSVLVVVVQMLTLRQNILQADQRVAEVFGPGFLLPALEFMQDNPPRVRGLTRLLMRTIPTRPSAEHVSIADLAGRRRGKRCIQD